MLGNLFSLVPESLLRESLPPKKLQNLWFTQAFNGQIQRTKFITDCLSEIRFTHVIETGTFLGNSTIALACLSQLEVHSIEIERNYYEFARARLQRDYPNSNVHLYHGSSDEILEEILNGMEPSENVIFLYLDAHWQNILPFQKEVSLLSSWGGTFLAVIDDFKVSNDSGYGYDVYKDVEVSSKGITVAEKLKWFTLKVPSESESGAKRGTGILIHEDLLKSLKPNLLARLQEIQ